MVSNSHIKYVLAVETLQLFDDALKQFAFVVELGGHFSSFDKKFKKLISQFFFNNFVYE